MFSQAQKILRELKSKISSQSKKNFVLEKDVRYLDSRIALLIQNRMALEEVRNFMLRRNSVLIPPSKTKSPAILKLLPIWSKASSQTMTRRRSMATYYSCSSLSHGILPICVDSCLWLKLIHFFKP